MELPWGIFERLDEQGRKSADEECEWLLLLMQWPPPNPPRMYSAEFPCLPDPEDLTAKAFVDKDSLREAICKQIADRDGGWMPYGVLRGGRQVPYKLDIKIEIGD